MTSTVKKKQSIENSDSEPFEETGEENKLRSWSLIRINQGQIPKTACEFQRLIWWKDRSLPV